MCSSAIFYVKDKRGDRGNVCAIKLSAVLNFVQLLLITKREGERRGQGEMEGEGGERELAPYNYRWSRGKCVE